MPVTPEVGDYTIDTIDYVTRIGNSSRAPIVIFATAHPGCRILCRIPAILTEGVR